MVEFQAGYYYIGDLCYLFKKEFGYDWEDFLDNHLEKQGGYGLYQNSPYFIEHTSFGDGSYFDQYGNSYSVDSGTLGCFRLDSLKINEVYESQPIKNNHAKIFFIYTNFTPTAQSGLFKFADVVIDTKGIDEDVDEWD